MPSTNTPTLLLSAFQLREPFGLILVLHWLHMECRSLPSGCCGINEPNSSPILHIVQQTRTKEELPLELKRSAPWGGARLLSLPQLVVSTLGAHVGIEEA